MPLATDSGGTGAILLGTSLWPGMAAWESAREHVSQLELPDQTNSYYLFGDIPQLFQQHEEYRNDDDYTRQVLSCIQHDERGRGRGC